jgi:hypothetical protein
VEAGEAQRLMLEAFRGIESPLEALLVLFRKK